MSAPTFRKVPWRTAATWGVTLSLLALLFWRAPLAEVARAARGAAPWFVPALCGWLCAIYLADCFATWKTLCWFVAPLRFKDLLLVRGAAYLLAVVHYAVGQGALVWFVHRATGAKVLRVTAALLLILGTNLLALLLFATLGLALAEQRPPALPLVVGAAWGGLGLYAALVALRPRALASRPVLDVLLSAGLWGHARTVLVRLPHVVLLFAFTWTALFAFGVRVPLPQALAALPVVYFISALPISVQGLGTTQAAMVLFFARYATGADAPAREANVLAASLSAQLVAAGAQALIGAACMRSAVAREVARASAAPGAGDAATPGAAE